MVFQHLFKGHHDTTHVFNIDIDVVFTLYEKEIFEIYDSVSLDVRGLVEKCGELHIWYMMNCHIGITMILDRHLLVCEEQRVFEE